MSVMLDDLVFDTYIEQLHVRQNARQAELEEVEEAYRIFCDYGAHPTAWRNLAHALTVFLGRYFDQSINAICPPRRHSGSPNHARIEYLAALDTEKLGYVARDVTWVLLHRVGLVETGLALAYNKSSGIHLITRKYVSELSQAQLKVVLADITAELNKRCARPDRLHGSPIAQLSSSWHLAPETELGILHHIEVTVSAEDAPLLENLESVHETNSRPAIYDLPKRLLRRALSVGSVQGRSSARGGLFGSRRNQVPRAYIEKLREHAAPRMPYDPHLDDDTIRTSESESLRELSDSYENGKTESSNPLPRPRSTDVLTAETVPRKTATKLDVIPEETFEHESRELSVWSDAESVSSSQTLDSVIDFYDQLYRSSNPSSKSLNDLSRRASIDVGELSRPEFQERLSIARRRLEDNSSICSGGEKSIRSALSGHQSFMTAKSRFSKSTKRVSARSSFESFESIETTSSLNSLTEDPLVRSSYREMLEERNLIPEPSMETDWSGRGQHAEFEEVERDHIPLQAEEILGRTRNAIVESVRCRRVRLVRKTMRCTRWTGLKREDALREVQHLYRIQHSHVVRLVGTYVIGTDLSILTYPCAEWNLQQFMETARAGVDASNKIAALRQFFTCLAKVLDFMHSFPLKHMDIKPQNLLVRDVRKSRHHDSGPYKIYFTDFGISRSYDSAEDCETENPTSFTRAYAAVEVVLQESRGLSADIFSLGCVFAEMLATILDATIIDRAPSAQGRSNHWSRLHSARELAEGGLRAYHAASEDVQAWVSALPLEESELQAARSWAKQMLEKDPIKRPTARQIADDPHLPFACLSCTLRTGPEDFEVAEPLTPRHGPPHPFRSSGEVPKPP